MPDQQFADPAWLIYQKMKSSYRIAIVGFAFLIGFSSPVYSQKFDNVWVMGYNWDSDPEAETYRLNFDTYPPRIEIAPGDLNIDGAYAGICDSLGALILYTNNCAIANGDGHIIEKGDSMTTGWELDWCKTYGWHPYEMQNIFIPTTLNPRKIFSLYKTTYKSSSGPLEIYQNKVNYSIIDLDAQNGLGEVVLKNKTCLQGRLSYGEVTAVKHGNGRDWWLPIPEETGNKIFMLLCNKDSFYLHHTESVGSNWGNSGSFQAAFSPDGSHYARYNRYYGLYLYDFDRCDGTLSNLRFLPLHTTTQGLRSGVGFSPDNRLLYFADYDSLYQIDIQESAVFNSKHLVAVYDGNVSIFQTKFSQIVNGPDGRIYIIPPAYTSSMHVINRPNLKGAECNLQQHFIEFPNPYGNPPNHPNYRLGPLDGSPCDTLGIDNHPLADFRPDPSDTNALALHFWDVSSYEPAEWLWDFGDPSSGPANMSQDTSPVHLFSAPGFYTVCLTVANSYSASSKCKVVELKTTGLNELESGEIVLRLYPNPTTGLMSISGLNAIGCLAEVFDISGRKVSGFKLTGNSIDLTQLPPGLYFLQIIRPGFGILGVSKVVVSH